MLKTSIVFQIFSIFCLQAAQWVRELERLRKCMYWTFKDRFREISRNIGEVNPFQVANPVLRILDRLFRQLPLTSSFNINPADFLIQDIPTSTAPPLPRTGPVIQQPPRADVIPQSGLTATETALLSPEEQIIRQRNRT